MSTAIAIRCPWCGRSCAEPWCETCQRQLAGPKAPRGSRVLDKEKTRKDIEDKEFENKKEAKARDSWRCRWPEEHKCRGGLEAAHIQAKGVGGDHGLRSETGNLISVCAWIHRSGPVTLEHHELKVEFETAKGCDGPVSFWKQDGGRDALGEPTYVCIARERSIGLLERD